MEARHRHDTPLHPFTPSPTFALSSLGIVCIYKPIGEAAISTLLATDNCCRLEENQDTEISKESVRDEANALLNQATDALDRDADDEAGQIAHRLAGLSAQFGMPDVASAARALAHACTQDPEGIALACRRLQASLDAVAWD